MDVQNVTEIPNSTVVQVASTSSNGLSYVCFVIMGIIIPLGLVCNSLSFVVFVTSKVLRRTSTGNYLMALCIADWLYLAGDLIRWMHTTSQESVFYLGVDFMYRNNVVCKAVHFVRYGSKLTSAWITIAITIERFISVRWPLHAHTLSTAGRAQIIILATYVICFGLGAYPLWTLEIQVLKNGRQACTYLAKVWEYNIWSWVVLRVGSLALPGALMLVLTALIIYSLTKAKNNRQKRLSCNADGRSKTVHGHNIERQLTIILVAVAISFIVLRLPYTITYYLNEYKRGIWPGNETMVVLMYQVKKITNIIASTNYVTNFFLYCVCGSTFRRQLRALSSCRQDPIKAHPAARQESRTFLTKMSTASPSSSSMARVRVDL